MLLFVLAVILAVVGVAQLLQGQIILGLIVLVAATVLGPGGYGLTADRGARPDVRS